MSTEKLLDFKKRIEEAKTQKSEISGQITAIEQQMESKFKVKGLAEAQKKLKVIGKELDEKESRFEKGMAELEQNFPEEV